MLVPGTHLQGTDMRAQETQCEKAMGLLSLGGTMGGLHLLHYTGGHMKAAGLVGAVVDPHLRGDRTDTGAGPEVGARCHLETLLIPVHQGLGIVILLLVPRSLLLLEGKVEGVTTEEEVEVMKEDMTDREALEMIMEAARVHHTHLQERQQPVLIHQDIDK